GRTAIRVVVSSSSPEHSPQIFLDNIAGTFGAFALGEGNKLGMSTVRSGKKEFIEHTKKISFGLFEHTSQIMNAKELATLWHPPGKVLAGIKNISWGKTLAGEPPENLPTTDKVPDEEKNDINFFAKA